MTKCAINALKTRKEIRTMKKAIRILAFILACLMLSAALVACNNSSDDPEDTTAANSNNPGGDETATVVGPPIEEKNYESEFQFLIMNDIFRNEFFYAAEQTQEVMNNAIFTRQEEVYSQIGVTILGKTHTDYQQYKTDFEISVKAEDNMYQTCLTHVNNDVAQLVTQGLCADFNDFDSINLDQSYWNKDLMESLAINDEMYLGYGDFCLASTYVIAYSKTLLDKYCTTALGDGDIYDLVHNKQWTLDKMIELASMSYEDTATGKDPSETYGIAGYMWVPAISFVHASGLSFTEYNKQAKKYEYIYKDANDMKKMEDLVTKIRELYNAEYSYFWGPFEAANSDPSKQVTLKGNNVLFTLTGTYGLIDYVDNNVEDFGVLPYPTWEEGQEYRHLSWNGYMVIPFNAADLTEDGMVGDTLELLGYYSAPVTEAFYEKLLGAQISESPDDADMLKIVWDTQVSDYGMAYSTYESRKMDYVVYGLPRCILGIENASSFSTIWNTIKSTVNKELNMLQAKKKAS